MATPSPPRAPSRSSRRNAHGSSPRPSPRSSVHSSPPRGPLLERSDSQKNSIYRQTPFPTLPSQVFAPKGDVYVFGDSQPSSEAPPPAIPPKSPTRLSSSSSTWTAASRGKQRLPDVPSPLFSPNQPSQTSAVDTSEGTPRSNVRRRTLTSASKSVDNASVGAASSAVDTGESSQMAAQRAALATRRPMPSTPSTESFAARTRRQHAFFEQSPRTTPHHRSVEKLRSQSSVGSIPSARKLSQPGQFESARSSEERPRSSSSPSTPTDAFIQALISSGTNVQYPKLRKPSATSLRSESTIANAAYPPPLRLQRKRANSQLAKAASIAPQSLEPVDSASDSSTRPPRVRPAPSQASFMTQTSDASTTWAASYPSYAVTYTHGEDEVKDTVAELHPRSVKRQRSDYQETSISRSSDKTSRESFRSSVGSFYHFLNDSRTAWAQVYYRGDGKLRLETPPGVEDDSYETPDYGPRSSSLPGQRHSPGSGGFPDRIYVPRVRPRVIHAGGNVQSYGIDQGPSQIRMVPQNSSSSPRTKTDTDSSIIPPAQPWADRSSSTNGTPESDSSTVPQMQTFWHSSSSPYNTTETDSSTVPRRHYPRRTYSSEAASSMASRNRPLIFDSSFCPAGVSQYSSHSRIPPPHRDGYSFATPENDNNNNDNDDDSIRVLPSVAAEPASRINSRVFNPTPVVPHLSLSKRHGPELPYWRTPSFDDRTGALHISNIQVALFCIGFLVPPVWWIAAFCPLPRRPQWDRNRTGARIEKEQSIDLFDSVEVYRYQKAQWWRNLNRFMALAGILIVAAVVCLPHPSTPKRSCK